ncbi:MAG: phage virion morphogenesis protein [Terracidiphilus sp.]
MSVVIQSNASHVTVSLKQFQLSLGTREQLMRTIGVGQLRSVRQTFRDGGSPAGSWAPLSPASLSWRKYSAGHKLLIDTGRLLNSVTFAVQGNSVVIGTGLSYAAVQQEGFDGDQSVKPYSYTRRQRSRDTFGRQQITNKLGRSQSVRRKLSSGIATVNVRAFTRHIRIPARSFLVFRPEDPARIHSEVEEFVKASAAQAGLEAK